MFRDIIDIKGPVSTPKYHGELPPFPINLTLPHNISSSLVNLRAVHSAFDRNVSSFPQPQVRILNNSNAKIEHEETFWTDHVNTILALTSLAITFINLIFMCKIFRDHKKLRTLTIAMSLLKTAHTFPIPPPTPHTTPTALLQDPTPVVCYDAYVSGTLTLLSLISVLIIVYQQWKNRNMCSGYVYSNMMDINCHHGQFSTHWNVAEGKANITLPDLTLGYRIEAISLSGIHEMEINRFEAASRFLGWGPGCMPNPSQKRLMCRFFGHIMQNWREDIGFSRQPASQPQNPPPVPPARAIAPPAPMPPGFIDNPNPRPLFVVNQNYQVPAPVNMQGPPNSIICPTPLRIVNPPLEMLTYPRAPPTSPIEICPHEEFPPQVNCPITPVPTLAANAILRDRIISKLAPIKEKPLSMTLKRKISDKDGEAPKGEDWEIEEIPSKHTTRASNKQTDLVKMETDHPFPLTSTQS